MKPPEIDVGIDECAKYVRLALEQKYGIKIEPGHAWDMRYSLKIIWPADGINYKEILKEGDVLGIYNPSSRHRTEACGEFDMKGNPRAYTHVGVYNGNGHVYHKLKDRIMSSSFREIEELGFSVKEVLRPISQSGD